MKEGDPQRMQREKVKAHQIVREGEEEQDRRKREGNEEADRVAKATVWEQRQEEQVRWEEAMKKRQEEVENWRELYTAVAKEMEWSDEEERKRQRQRREERMEERREKWEWMSEEAERGEKK